MNKVILISLLLLTSAIKAQNYTVGKSWDKKSIHNTHTKYHHLIRSIGEIGYSATLFYIGEGKGQFSGRHYTITNSHVCPSLNHCLNKNIEFAYFRNSRGSSLKGFVKNTPIINTLLDLAVLEVQFTNLESFDSKPYALKLSSKLPSIYQPLISSGYGFFNNSYGVLMTEVAGDCRVFSHQNDIRRVKDPDQVNPLPHLVYSFLVGCDVSHGDSGSPLIDYHTGEVIGLLWTGRMPKDPRIRHPLFSQLGYEFLWSQLNYAVPSAYIKKLVNRFFLPLNNFQ